MASARQLELGFASEGGARGSLACAPRRSGACSTRTRGRVPARHGGEDGSDRRDPPIGGRERREGALDWAGKSWAGEVLRAGTGWAAGERKEREI